MRVKSFPRILTVLFLLAAGGISAKAQVPRHLRWSNYPAGIHLTSSSLYGLSVTLDISTVRMMEIPTGQRSFLRILHPGLTPDYKSGYPELPVMRKLIEIPAGSKVVVEHISYETHILSLSEMGFTDKLYPNQPSVQKNTDPTQQKFVYREKAYEQDELTGDTIISIHKEGILRGRQLATLTFSPFRYNPVTNTLEIRDHIHLTLRFVGGNLSKTISRHKSLSTPVFEPTFNKIFNYTNDRPKSVTTPPLKMVILTDTIFKNSLKDFIRWKTAKGIEVVVAYRGDPAVGTTVAEMKAYLKNLYDSATPDNPAPSYLLIIGDVEQIPASSTAGQYTDLYYAEYDGNGDYIPDIYFGRFSARDSAELAPILEKNLEYEQYLFPDPSFLGEAVMIAGVDGAYASVWGNGQINYGTNYYYNTDHGILSHTYLYPESGSSDAQIIQDISNGVGFVNYTGHGYSDRWEDPRFSITDIDGLQNNHKYPLMIGNGCVTATFGLPECFAEALVRAPGKGALSYIGCSNDSYWDEDYYWAVGVGPIVANPKYEDTGLGMYDRLFHDHQEPEQEWYINQSQMVFAGNLAVMTGVPSRAQYYWEIYQLLGDPSLMVYLSVPDALPVNVPHQIPTGLTNLTVITEDHAVIALSGNDTLVATAYSNDDGIAILNFPPLIKTGYIHLVGTRQNRRPFIDSIEVISNDNPYISLEETMVNDSATNGDGLADFGESFYLAARIHNLGLTDAGQVTAVLSTTSPHVVLSDSTMEAITTLTAQNDTLINRAFRIQIADSVQDGEVITFAAKFSDQNDSTWISYFTLRLHAPELYLGSLSVNDLEKGNGNRRLEPGESVKLNLPVFNQGSATSDSLIIHVSMPDSMVVTYVDTIRAAPLGPASEGNYLISLTLDPAVAYGTLLEITAGFISGGYYAEKIYTIPVGLSYDDFELDNFNALPWEQDSLHPWIITDETPYEGTFSAHSGSITNNQSSQLSIAVETFQDDSVHFFAKVSSEKDYDFLRFIIDGNEMGKWAGEIPWSIYGFPLPAGQHTLTWKYTKDGSVSKGYDASWIDYVVFPLYSFSTSDVGIMQILSPKSGSGLSSTETLTVTVKNFGNSTITDIPVGFILDQEPVVKDTLRTTLNSGDTATFSFQPTLDLSNIRSYHLKVFTNVSGDQVPVNDTLQVLVIHEGVIDVSLDSILSPIPDSVYTGTEKIGVRLINLSNGSVSDIPLAYVINGQPPVQEIADTLFNPGDTLDYFFLQTADMSDSGDYTIVIYCTITGDVVTSNDTLRVVLYNKITSVDPGDYIREIRLYPNPARNDLTLQMNLTKPVSFNIRIIDLSGKVWFNRLYEPRQGNLRLQITLQGLVPGTYYLMISNPSGRRSLPFIKISY
ncbi:MAG: T9SS type A sorting domain-containing protein [Chlorobi bacterium]|nr:T9SS type A sorting domain-containing protein [Chlorobiota bacterium]